MKYKICYMYRIFLGVFIPMLIYSTGTASVPVDLEIIGMAGDLGPDGWYAVVHITSDGQASYFDYESSDITSQVVNSSTFSITNAELEQLWQVIQESDFFNLEPEYAADEIMDKSFAQLIIAADGTDHTVKCKNIYVEAFDNIISKINLLTPGENDLIYDTTEPFTFVPLDICDQPYNREQTLSKQDEYFDISNLFAVKENSNAHPGSMVAYHMTLKEAVSKGIVTFKAKGGSTAFGDGVSITINNTNPIKKERLTLSMHLEFWGEAASPAMSETIVDAIVDYWGTHTTSSGQNLLLDISQRTFSGGTFAPGTLGYHQIEIVTSRLFSETLNGNLNWGVGTGTWHTAGGSEVNHRFAHNAGHLLGLPNRYELYEKQLDGNWIRERDNKDFTPLALAQEMAKVFKDLSIDDLMAMIQDGRRHMFYAMPGSENDVMAIKTGTVQQSDIDAIAAKAGLVIEIRPGDVLVNKVDKEQNYVISRFENIFVPSGGIKTLEGIYVACIDGSRSFPNEGSGFDLGPSLSEWQGIEAAQLLLLLIDYINEKERFCLSSGYVPQSAVWRITGNRSMDDNNVTAFLRDAGIEAGDKIFEFPGMTNPHAESLTTSLVIPQELYIPEISSASGNIFQPGTNVTLKGSVQAPVGVLQSADYSWMLEPPEGSAAVLSNHQGNNTMFMMDVRGIYQVNLQANVTDSLANMITVETKEKFTAADANTETFETGTLLSDGPFYWQTGTEYPWLVTDRDSHTGMFAAVSSAIPDYGKTELSAVFEQPSEGTISFAYKVSSEIYHDYLSFSVDGTILESWSGILDWNIYSVNLPAGKHTATWTYEKDDFMFHSQDRVWIDDIFFPANAVFVSVQSSADKALPTSYTLFQNYPNPFNSSTTIRYDIPDACHVELEIYNTTGQLIETLTTAWQIPGQYTVKWDGSQYSNGIYFYKINAGDFMDMKKMLYLK